MDFLRAVFGLTPRKVQPAHVPTDEIIPATFFDDTPLNRSIVLYLTFRFNDVLDASSLRQSLSTLVEIDGWRKLGGRFRLNHDGKLEIHVPQKFTAERPAVGYSEESFDVGIDEHPLASQMPRPAQGHQYVQAGPRTFVPFAKSKRMPATFLDFVYSDAPQLSVHISKFTDTTLVSLSWCHVTADAVGMGGVLRAWSLVLAGRQNEVPPMLPQRDDPLDQVGTEQESRRSGDEEPVMASKLLTLPKMVLLALRFFVLDPWLYGRMEEHMVFVPKATTQKMKTAAVATLSAGTTDDIVLDSRSGNPFLSSGDVITAWFAAMASSVLGPSSKRSVLIYNPVDIRGRLPKIFPGNRDKVAYVQNATLNYFVLAPAKQVVPAGTDLAALGRFAASIRHALVQQTTVPQILAMIRLYRATIAKTGNSPMFGDSNSYAMLFSNWTKARFFEVMDFSPAVISSRAERRGSDGDWPGTTSGMPVYYHSQSLMPGPRTNRNWLCMNGNVNGDYWVHGYLLPEVWTKIEDALKGFEVDG